MTKLQNNSNMTKENAISGHNVYDGDCARESHVIFSLTIGGYLCEIIKFVVTLWHDLP